MKLADYSTQGIKFYRGILTLAKGAILILWIATLIWGAVAAVNGKSSKLILSYFGDSFFDNTQVENKNSPRAWLVDYSKMLVGRLPLASLLESALPGWDKNDYSPKLSHDDYVDLFDRATDRLYSYSADAKFDPSSGQIGTDFVPSAFRQNRTLDKVINLTPDVRTWIESDRESNKAYLSKLKLIDTFVLLIIIGAFGSLIFLTRDYVMNQEEKMTPLSSYLFRPILGIFLAVSMFVVDIAANTVVSTSDILQVRRETLFLLALAAGLLSDKAYAFIDRKARGALEGIGSDAARKKGLSTAAPTPPTEPKTP
jgi:hypothetical protein